MNVMMTASKIMSKFVGQQDREQRARKRQSGQKQRRMVVRAGKGLEQSIERSRFIVRIRGRKMSSGHE